MANSRLEHERCRRFGRRRRVRCPRAESTQKFPLPPFDRNIAGDEHGRFAPSSTVHLSMRHQALLLAVTSQILLSANAFYLPGAAPHDFHDGERVDLFVNALTPMIGSSDNAKLVGCRSSLKMSLVTCSSEIPNQLYAGARSPR